MVPPPRSQSRQASRGLQNSRAAKGNSKKLKSAMSNQAKPLEEEEWYHGLLPREDINRMLKTQGDWLVRKTEVEGKTKHVLSVCWDGKPRHVVLHLNSKTLRHTIDPNDRDFASIQDLVEYYRYSNQPLPRVPYVLGNPVPRQEWELRHEQITLDKKLGQGAFGEVYKGMLKRPDGELIGVAVKRSNATTMLTKEQIADIVAESRIMQKFKHPNIVRLWGVAAETQPVMIVLELVSGGGLDSYLQKNVGKINDTQKMKFCADGAQGLGYLHSQKCIHRDIAARNCLLSGEGQVKISDFGLSQNADSTKVNKNVKLPIRWLAPETLTTAAFTYKTDIWSYGILMWEVFHDGQEPYPGMRVMEVNQQVRSGFKMSLEDEKIPIQARTCMAQCWEWSPELRPDFTVIIAMIEAELINMPPPSMPSKIS